MDGCDTVALTVNPRNHPAIRLYESVGFEKTGTDDDYRWLYRCQHPTP